MLVAGGRVTGRAVLAALTRPRRDGDPVRRRRGHPAAIRRRRHADRGLGDRRDAHRRLRAGGDQPGFPADRAGARRRRGGGRPGLGRRRVGLAARPGRALRAAAALAGGHRHQRQDHHDVDAARHAGRRRPAQPAVRQHRQPGARRVARARRLLAVELSSFQLHWAPSLRPEAGVVLNIAEDHLDWHGTLADYAAAKAGVLRGRVAVAGLDDPRAAALLSAAPAPVAGRASGSANPPPASSACATACWSTGRSPTSVRRWRRGRRPSRCRARWACSTRWPPPRWPAASACPPRRSRRAVVVPGGPASRRAGRRRRPDQLRRRLQGDQPARRRGVAARLPGRGVDRRRSAQGRIGGRDRRTCRVAAGRGRC